MKKGVVYILIGLFLTSCFGLMKSGGPCKYENIPVEWTVIEFEDGKGYRLKAEGATSKAKRMLNRTYTSSYRYDNVQKGQLQIGEKFESSLTIMTKGSCNPQSLIF